jgi:hypothetical protein
MDFEMILNELSFTQPAQDIPTARQRMSQFINTLLSPNIGRLKRVLRTHKEFQATELAPDYSLAQWRNDPKVDKYEQRFLRTLVFKSPFLFELPLTLDKSFAFEFIFEGNVIKNPNNQICGLGAAYLLESLAVSLFSEPKWDKAKLNLQIEWLNEEGNLEEQSASICHASRVKHVQTHKEWINEWLRQQVKDGTDLWERRVELFPHLIFCDNVYNNLVLLGIGNPLLCQVVKRLFALEHYSQNWLPDTAFDKDQLPNATPDDRAQYCKTEFTFLCPDDKERLFSWHLRLTPDAWRIHFYPEKPGEIIIGYIGEKLKK